MSPGVFVIDPEAFAVKYKTFNLVNRVQVPAGSLSNGATVQDRKQSYPICSFCCDQSDVLKPPYDVLFMCSYCPRRQIQKDAQDRKIALIMVKHNNICDVAKKVE